MLGRTFRAGIPLVCIVAMGGAAQAQPDCAGQARTIANQSVIVLERGGVLAGVSYKQLNVTGYLFNPDKDTKFVIAVELTI